jgi:hypothetical protein
MCDSSSCLHSVIGDTIVPSADFKTKHRLLVIHTKPYSPSGRVWLSGPESGIADCEIVQFSTQKSPPPGRYCVRPPTEVVQLLKIGYSTIYEDASPSRREGREVRAGRGSMLLHRNSMCSVMKTPSPAVQTSDPPARRVVNCIQ